MGEMLVFGMFIGILVGIWFCILLDMFISSTEDHVWQNKAIKNNAGYYHLDTGKFTWNLEKDSDE